MLLPRCCLPVTFEDFPDMRQLLVAPMVEVFDILDCVLHGHVSSPLGVSEELLQGIDVLLESELCAGGTDLVECQAKLGADGPVIIGKSEQIFTAIVKEVFFDYREVA